MDENKVIPLDDVIEVVKANNDENVDKEVKADEKEVEATKTDVVDSAEVVVEPKDEGETDVVVSDDNSKDEEVIIEATKDEPAGEIIESDVVEDEDKKRDAFLAEAQDICDSADYGVNVKMPYSKGRETYRSVVFRFAKTNPQFLDKKYSNLRLDTYTNELCDEVKSDMFNKIKSHKPKAVTQKGVFVDTGKGYKVMRDF